MDAVIDRIAALPLVAATDTKVARWLDGVELPLLRARRGFVARSQPKRIAGRRESAVTR